MGRLLDERAAKAWAYLSGTRFVRRFSDEGTLVGTRPFLPADNLLQPPWVEVLEHDRIPFISYPYEWSFSMLKDAGLLHLDLMEAALAEDGTLRDCSPYNVQWRGSQPVFIDIPSFAPWTPGDPWVGYRQFCRQFLYPLLLQAHKKWPFQRGLRSRLDGYSAEETARAFGRWEFFRPGLLMDVFLQARFESALNRTGRPVRRELREAGFAKEMILANLRRLRRIMNGLTWREKGSVWSDYARERNYSADEYAAKKDFVREVTGRTRRSLVWDLGANTGDFSRLAAETADCVVAMDADAWVVEQLYTRLKSEGQRTILPLVMDLTDPSPAQGWRGRERASLTQRGRPDLILALALVHHLVISGQVPLDEVVDELAATGAEIVVEFVSKSDAMVQRLLANRDDLFDDYTPEHFEKRLSERFTLRKTLTLVGGGRRLYHAVPRSCRAS